ncbi:hypothetical protein M9Y10_041576 [Tritrichomonas musculus]|uniref:Uncharacterized protein n=1 Tax=Tritrichomonas musculus TaxID=1915356 RepID=A0ABR2K5R6_9EUKA
MKKNVTYHEFRSQYKNLENTIQAQTLGASGDNRLQDQLKALSIKIKKTSLNERQKADLNRKIKILKDMANGVLRNTFTLDDIGAARKKPLS